MTKAELIKVLVKSQETRRQIVGNLISFTHAKIEEINGYCALGALACEKKLFKQQNWVDGSPRDIVEPAYSDIINAYGLENSLGGHDFPECPVCSTSLGREISSIITHLNDSHRLTFVQIAKHLKTIRMKRLKKRDD